MKHTLIALYNLALRYMAPFFVSLGFSLILTPLVRRFSIRYKFVSFPKQDRWRMRVVATLGGISIFVSFLVTYLMFGARDIVSMGFIFGAFGMFWLGLVDDIIHIKPDTKLIGQIIIACIIIMFGIDFKFIKSPIINIPLTILWVVGISNAFNLLDNMDGLSAGVASISAFMICIYSVINSNAALMVMSLVLLGSTLGFLRYNFNPAKIFMGDCGSMFLGYVLAVSSLMGTIKERSGLLITLVIPVLLLAVPIFDTVFVTFMRTLNNKPISQGGKDHTSHRLVALGLSERNAVLLLYAVSAISGLSGVLCNKFNFIHVSVILLFFMVGLFIFAIFLGTEAKVYSEEEINGLRMRRKLKGKVIFNGFIYNKRRIVEVMLDFAIISVSYVTAFLLRFEGALFGLNVPLILQSLPIILIIKLLMFYFFGLYRGVWRYIGLYDIIAIFKAVSLGSILSVLSLLFIFRFKQYSRTVFIIDWILTLFLISGLRILFRLYREFFANIRLSGKRALIFGAGDAGEMALREIRQNIALGYKPIGFVDDDEEKLDKIIHGVKVLGGGSDLERLIYRHKIDEVLVAIPHSSKRRLSEIYSICNKANVPFREVSKIIQIRKDFSDA